MNSRSPTNTVLKNTVTVCSHCLTASCWHYEFCCDQYRTAGTVEKTVDELMALGREHPDNWTRPE